MASLLAALETLEATQLNLGLYNTHVTAEDLHCYLAESEGVARSIAEVEAALRDLVTEGEAIEWQPGCFRSRIAETVRCLRLLRQRFWWQGSLSDAPLLVEDVRVEFRQRQRPRRNAITAMDALPMGLPEKVSQAFQAAIEPIATFSVFQARAIQEVFACAARGNPENESFIIAGDTGAGKTEAFLFPILLDIASEPPELRRRAGVRAVLVYPRIRLARNQLGRLLRYTGRFYTEGGPRLTIGIQNGDVPSHADEMTQKWVSRKLDGKTWYQVALLETCVKCGKGHYWVAAADPDIETDCPRLVCDCCGHVIDTLHITQKALEGNAPDLLIITDVSLSQWLARQKYTHLWGLWSGSVQTVPPRFLVLDEVHLYEQLKGAHISRLIKRFQARVKLVYQQTQQPVPAPNPVVIGVSATLNEEQRFLAKLLDVDPQDKFHYDRLRVIKPHKDELEPTEGRERYLFIYPRQLSPTPRSPQYRVNDQTAAIQIVMCAMHNLKTEIEWRGLAFFDSINDLRQFRYNYDADPDLQWIVGFDAVGKPIPPANQSELWRIRTDRQVNGQVSKIKPLCVGGCAQHAQTATLYQCPHFQSGDCWVFAKHHGWNYPLKVASSVYAGVEPQATSLDDKDLIPTSPSLEVGYDDDAIHLVYQHKAPPNAASFIQRRGRAGRDPDDSPVIVTLLWPYRRDDAFYFFHPEALYAPTFDDIPLNAGNFNVQRTHTLLAFFDLLACLRRQNVDGIADDPRIFDFTQVGWEDLVPEMVQSYSWLPDPYHPGQKRIVIRDKRTKKDIWISGGPVASDWVRQAGGVLYIKGWLALANGLTDMILKPTWEYLSRNDLFTRYIGLAEIASNAFKKHHTYPFLVSWKESVPRRVINTFGNKKWHSFNDRIERSNWLKTYKYIDWMLQGSEEATTLTVHYPNPNMSPLELEESTLDVTFALTELLPGNVTFRLREKQMIHWTPIPQDGKSTFLYPEEDVMDDDHAVVGRRLVAEFLPAKDDIARKPDSIFGVPRYLEQRFPGLPFMTVKRLRVESFGPPDQQYSPFWFYDPRAKCALRVQAEQTGLLPISRRSSARANSVIVPYIAKDGHTLCQQLFPPLDTLFAAVEGFLGDGCALLGYTRIFYEMQIDLKTDHKKCDALEVRPEELTLRRDFYDEHGQRTLVGYAIETQGIRFQLNPDLLSQTVAAILGDTELRLRLRHVFAVYSMATHAAEANVFIRTYINLVDATVDYWLHEVVPHSQGEPRLLDLASDQIAAQDYYFTHRVVRDADVAQNFVPHFNDIFVKYLNDTLQLAFKDTSEFHDFVESVVLHSLSALLKNLTARLGGVESDALVAYADLPLLDNVDRSLDPRILIMDTVEGGSGGIAQAFDRLDLTDNEGSLWWMLQRELGVCPIANGEALVRAVLTHATPDQIRAVQNAENEPALNMLLSDLDLTDAVPDAVRVLGRMLFNRIDVGGQTLNPALMMQELFAYQALLDAQIPGEMPAEAVVRQLILDLDPVAHPYITQLRAALLQSGVVTEELDHELGLQLLVLYNRTCEDGCPVCMSMGSDIEHPYLAPLLDSRRALKKLREVLLYGMPQGDCLAALADSLLEQEPVHVQAVPGALGNQLNPAIGLGTIAEVGEDGQIQGASTSPLFKARDAMRDFIADGRWEERWGGAEHKPYETPGGVRVRSKSEYIIATKLEAAGICFEYEPRLPYTDDEGKTRFIHPDFHLYEYNLYVEYWGRSDPDYVESRQFKERVYEQLAKQRGIRVLYLEAGDVEHDMFMEKTLSVIGCSSRE